MTEYRVRATPWAYGWELDIPGVGVTQSRNLRAAEAIVRDYIRLDLGKAEAAKCRVTIVPTIEGATVDIDNIRSLQSQAERMQAEAASASRALAARLRNAGATGADIAHLLGVSAQRVSQLLKDTTASTTRR